MNNVRRMWINQPSTSQPLHRLDGTNVLASFDSPNVVTVYFIDGDTFSMQVTGQCLSPGWRAPTKENENATTQPTGPACSTPADPPNPIQENKVKKPHKHADVIKAWADGARIQCRVAGDDVDWKYTDNPQWFGNYEYRVKPENVVRYLAVYKNADAGTARSTHAAAAQAGGERVLRFEINPDTLELVSATMEKP